jgi:F-type H+-transporting ATPase subunit b
MKRISEQCGAIGIVLLTAQSVLGAEDAHGGDKVNIFGGDLGVAIWTLLIFVLVVLVLGKFAWGPLLAQLQKREEFIRDSLATAKSDREAAEARLREYEQRLAKAREEASAIVDEGRRDAEEVAKRVMVEARQAARAEQDRAIREIDIARKTALKDLYDQSAQLAMTMAGSVLKREMKAADHEQLIKEALVQMRESSAN